MFASSKVTGVGEIQLPKLTVLYLKDHCYTPKTLLCKINISAPALRTTEHDLVVDPGSAVSILPQHIYKFFCYTPLLPPTCKLVTYTSRSISVHGCLQVKVSQGDLYIRYILYILYCEKRHPPLGRHLMAALDICIKGNTVLPPATASTAPVLTTATTTPPPTTTSAPSSCVPASLDISCARNFVYKLKTDPTVKPVQ